MVLSSQARVKSRRWPFRRATLVAALVVTAVTAAVWASAAAPSPSSRASQSVRTYVAEVQQPLDEEAESAAEVAQVRSGSLTIGRQQLATSLIELDEAASSAAGQITSTDPVGRVPIDTTALDSAAQMWARGARLFEVGVLASIGPGVTPPAAAPGVVIPAAQSGQLWSQIDSVDASGGVISTLEAAGADMATGDREYRAFLGSERKFSTKGARLPTVEWSPDTSLWSASSLAVFEQGMATSSNLVAMRRVALVLATTNPQPIPVQASGQVPSMVDAGGFSVTAVVANTGNVDDDDVAVQVSIVPTGPPSGGGPTPVSLSRHQSIDLVPAQNRTVTFSGINVPSQVTYTLTVSVIPPPSSAIPPPAPFTETFTVAP